MKAAVMVMDLLVRFRIVAFVQTAQQTQTWEMQVMCMEQVTDLLTNLSFMDFRSAGLLKGASTTITPQEGITTVPLSQFATLIELVHPDSDPVTFQAQEGHVLIARGETTEEALASAGFVVRMSSPLQ